MKYRHEYKYLVSAGQINILQNRIKGLLSLDPHAKEGKYNICSLYFDDYHNSCFYENENGTDPREKFRIRVYDHNTDIIKLECKRKEHQKTLKTGCTLTAEECNKLIKGEPVWKNNGSQVLNKLNSKIITTKMHPAILVEYERIPYVYKSGNVRVTFDINLSSSNDISNFPNINNILRPVMPRGLHLMEVKWDEYIPDHIYNALQIDNLRQASYSKYYLCKKFELKNIK